MKQKLIKTKAKKKIKKVAPNHNKIIKGLLPQTLPEAINKEALSQYINEMKELLANTPEPIEDKSRCGVPLKYRKDYCIKVILEMAKGKDKNTVASEMGVTYQNFHHWRKSFPEFDLACKIGEQLTIRWWTEVGRLNIWNKNFNQVLWMMNMTNRTRWLSSRNQETRKIKRVDKKILELNIKDDNDRAGKILSILQEAGAITTGVEKVIDSEIN